MNTKSRRKFEGVVCIKQQALYFLCAFCKILLTMKYFRLLNLLVCLSVSISGSPSFLSFPCSVQLPDP